MQAKFTYSPTGKVLVKQTNKKKKKIEEQGKKTSWSFRSFKARRKSINKIN